MSCNGCRVLRKGCSDACILRPCLQWIDSPASQAHATVFVAKFFGRAGLLSFLSSVPPPHRPALFQSLLFEACGRAVNPVGGAVGLLWTGRWDVCQAAVDTILNGGAIHPVADAQPPPLWRKSSTSTAKDESCNRARLSVAGLDLDLDLSLTMPCFTESMLSQRQEKRRRPASPSEVSVTTSADSNLQFYGGGDRKLLGLFV